MQPGSVSIRSRSVHLGFRSGAQSCRRVRLAVFTLRRKGTRGGTVLAGVSDRDTGAQEALPYDRRMHARARFAELAVGRQARSGVDLNSWSVSCIQQ